MLIEKRWHSSTLYIRFFREAGCNTEKNLVVSKVIERLAVSKQSAQKFDIERFNLRKLKDLESRKEYQTEITKSLVALAHFYYSENINITWEIIKENIKISAKESLGLHKFKQHKPWLDEECLHFLDQRKQAKMKCLRDPNQSIVDNLNHVRREARKHLRYKNNEYLRAKID